MFRRNVLTALVMAIMLVSLITAQVLQLQQSDRNTTAVVVGEAALRERGPRAPTSSELSIPSSPTMIASPSVPASPAPPSPPPLPPPPLPPPPPPPPPPIKGAPCLSTAKACVKLSTNQAWLIEGGEVIYGPVKISHGRKGYRTPPGTFQVQWKNKEHRSRAFDLAPMPYSVFFNGGIAFHQGRTSSLSHGCVRMARGSAQRFFSTLAKGDTVQVVP